MLTFLARSGGATVPLLRASALKSACHLLNTYSVPSRLLSSGEPGKEQQKPTSSAIDTQAQINQVSKGPYAWLLRLMGFYTKEATVVRNSTKLYLNARDQANRPEFCRSLGQFSVLPQVDRN
jgi:hypothetical protein